ncbi:MAG: hypothetical protein ABII76_01265 [Pseudomonadota bacterium]
MTDEPMEQPEQEAQAPEPEQPKRAKRAKLIAVKPVKRSGAATCVQWDEKGWPRRAWVPAEEVVDNKVNAESLEAGMPEGIRWEERVTFAFDVAVLAQALYRRGIFTHQDVAANKPGCMAAIHEAVSPVFRELLSIEE